MATQVFNTAYVLNASGSTWKAIAYSSYTNIATWMAGIEAEFDNNYAGGVVYFGPSDPGNRPVANSAPFVWNGPSRVHFICSPGTTFQFDTSDATLSSVMITFSGVDRITWEGGQFFDSNSGATDVNSDRRFLNFIDCEGVTVKNAYFESNYQGTAGTWNDKQCNFIQATNSESALLDEIRIQGCTFQTGTSVYPATAIRSTATSGEDYIGLMCARIQGYRFVDISGNTIRNTREDPLTNPNERILRGFAHLDSCMSVNIHNNLAYGALAGSIGSATNNSFGTGIGFIEIWNTKASQFADPSPLEGHHFSIHDNNFHDVFFDHQILCDGMNFGQIRNNTFGRSVASTAAIRVRGFTAGLSGAGTGLVISNNEFHNITAPGSSVLGGHAVYLTDVTGAYITNNAHYLLKRASAPNGFPRYMYRFGAGVKNIRMGDFHFDLEDQFAPFYPYYFDTREARAEVQYARTDIQFTKG